MRTRRVALGLAAVGLMGVVALVTVRPGGGGGSSAVRTGPSVARDLLVGGPTFSSAVSRSPGATTAATTAVVSPGAAGAPANAAAGTGSGVGQAVAPGEPKVVKSGQIEVSVAKGGVASAFDRVTALAQANLGFVSDSNLVTGDNPSGRLTMRVPEDHLGAVLASLSGLGKVDQQQLQGQDVTGQLVDLDARITSLQAEEDALRTLLGKAQTTAEILQVQDKLFSVRTQIEQLAAQQGSLSDRAAYATLTVTVHEPAPPPVHAPRPVHDGLLARAGRRAVHNSAAVASGLVLVLAWLAPVLAVALVVGPVVVLVLRRRRRVAAAVAATT
jgi:hypothetical protein